MATRARPNQTAAQRRTQRDPATGSASRGQIGETGGRGLEAPGAGRAGTDRRGTPTYGPEQAGFAGAARGSGPLQIGTRRYGPY